MDVLVLGATGFLGGHIAEHLRTFPGARVLRAGHSSSADLRIDLANETVEGLAALLADLRPAAVVNCAGAVTGDALLQTGLNARGPAVLAAALRAVLPGTRLVHLGSAAEYGACEHGTSLAETAAARPGGLYGATKLAGTLAVTEAAAKGQDAVVLRVFNPIGPGAPGTSLAGRLAAELHRAGPDGTVTVGDLSAHRDFVDARDVARAVGAALTAAHPLPPVVNVAGGEARPVRAVADALVAAARFGGRIEEHGAGSERSAAVSWQQADISTARALGWEPRITLAESLADLWHGLTAAAAAGPNDTQGRAA
ncbi:NAD-dependent epimerase/dehydratase family protein [Streptomyces sp. NRRL B-24484]|uniref:NAD-dependent epimerase/dehydratase family protein n=1 Tax=Streptomyces sp. NRRL B-24484 TaxID=1463833 RepID=UPI0004BE8FFE|nr:NAD-dependent epimerase/dehydratase family protein [Streptomyces sp. NRRL B-24484]